MTIAITLYHGTTYSFADSIEASGFQRKKGKFLSFGDGAYFYRDLPKAQEYADQEYKTEGCVLEVEISVPRNRIRSFTASEIRDSWPSEYNRRSVEEDLLVLDFSVDEGIYVIRPEALELIRVVRRYA